MPSTQDKKKGSVTALLSVPSGKEIYDRIMAGIERELVTGNLKKLDAPYAKETVKERKVRYQRYAKAFVRYRKESSLWANALKKAVQRYKKAIAKAVESITLKKENTALRALEQQMNIT